MAKDTFWFKHDYHARSDKEMMRLRMKMGMRGVGIYWCIIEMLYEEDGYLLRSECERIAFELQSQCDEIKSVIEDFNLFKKDGEKFWSDSLILRLNHKKDKSVKARESAFKKWGNANALHSDSEGNAIRGDKSIYKKENKKEKDEPEPEKKNKFCTKPLPEHFNGLPENKIPSALEAHTLAFGMGITENDVNRMWNVFKTESLTGENFYNSEEKVYTHFLRWIRKQSLNKPKDFNQPANQINKLKHGDTDKYRKNKTNV